MKAVYLKEGNTSPYTASADVAAGDVIALGNNRFGVALSAIADGDTDDLAVTGVFTFSKAAVAISVGDLLYWNSTDSVVTNIAVSNAYIGRAFAAAASGDDTVAVSINDMNVGSFTSGVTPQAKATVGTITAPTTATITGTDYTGQAAILKAAIEQNDANIDTLKTALDSVITKLVTSGVFTA